MHCFVDGRTEQELSDIENDDKMKEIVKDGDQQDMLNSTDQEVDPEEQPFDTEAKNNLEEAKVDDTEPNKDDGHADNSENDSKIDKDNGKSIDEDQTILNDISDNDKSDSTSSQDSASSDETTIDPQPIPESEESIDESIKAVNNKDVKDDKSDDDQQSSETGNEATQGEHNLDAMKFLQAKKDKEAKKIKNKQTQLKAKLRDMMNKKKLPKELKKFEQQLNSITASSNNVHQETGKGKRMCVIYGIPIGISLAMHAYLFLLPKVCSVTEFLDFNNALSSL